MLAYMYVCMHASMHVCIHSSYILSYVCKCKIWYTNLNDYAYNVRNFSTVEDGLTNISTMTKLISYGAYNTDKLVFITILSCAIFLWHSAPINSYVLP